MPEQIPPPEELTLLGPREQVFMKEHPMAESGYPNTKGPRNDGCLNLAGTHQNQVLYLTTCTKCSAVCTANGSDIHHRKCLKCQGGATSSCGWRA